MASPWPGNAFLTTEQFLIVCPEFAATDFKLVDQTVQEASMELDPCVWGWMLSAGHKYLTAHKLALSPSGQGVRLVKQPNGEGFTTYLTHFDALVKKLPIATGIAGWPSPGGPPYAWGGGGWW